ncbi:DMT family transporter [Sedimenticola hydrogenitrophicus]|uniref:DMT family transporter n=1 Tax=Sedimenticola hydrogenitrophicus TaxID=2967975 RepID=UPI0023B0E47E|nr:DMT family transporter [Sedimenticola hydrogenitrophicus]
MTQTADLKTLSLTALTMLAFAANSLLCRLALGEQAIDAASFTTVRLASGALMLWLIVRLRGALRTDAEAGPQTDPQHSDWLAAGMLFLYAAAFSFAYITLSAGTGALILFGVVQLTMFFAGLRRGEPFSGLAWIGLTLAMAGLVYLVSPGVTAPEPVGALLMTLAGLGWGIYSLRGRGVANPLHSTARNFLLTLPLGLLLSLVFLDHFHFNPRGLAIAVTSGAIASGLGYVLWYAALRSLSATGAATVQLSVPVIAAFGGVLLLSEAVTLRLLVASVAVLGGIAIVLTRRHPARA